MGKKSNLPTGCMFFGDSLNLLSYLSDAEAGKVIKAVVRYYLTGEEPSGLEQTGERMACDALRGNVDRSLERYREICERNRANRNSRLLPPGEHYVLPD